LEKDAGTFVRYYGWVFVGPCQHVPTGLLLDTLKMEIKHRNQRKEVLLEKIKKIEKIIEVNG